VRFEETVAVSDPKVALAVHELLGGRVGRYPKLEAVKGARLDIQINLGGGGVLPTEAPFSGWKMTSDDGWTVTLMPDHVALETSNYTTWEGDFGPRLGQIIDAVSETVAPATEQRVGLRYIDRIDYPPVASASEWQGRIADEFLGPILHPILGPAVKTTQQQVVIDISPGVQCVVRHGYFVEPKAPQPAYLLDFDVFRAAVRPFDPGEVKAAADTFNVISLQMFQQATTAKLRQSLASE